jgi:hypothetical protein
VTQNKLQICLNIPFSACFKLFAAWSQNHAAAGIFFLDEAPFASFNNLFALCRKKKKKESLVNIFQTGQ